MIEKATVYRVIFEAIDEINQQLPKDQQLAKSPDTVLHGNSGNLDSLGLVNLIVATEESIEDKFGLLLNLADQQAMSQKNSPFQTVETLADYISLILEQQTNGSKAL